MLLSTLLVMIFIINFEQIPSILLLSLLQTLNMIYLAVGDLQVSLLILTEIINFYFSGSHQKTVGFLIISEGKKIVVR